MQRDAERMNMSGTLSTLYTAILDTPAAKYKQLRYVLVFTMCANLLVMRLFEVATSLRYWNNSGCICYSFVVIHLQHVTQMKHSSTFSVGVGGDFGNCIQGASPTRSQERQDKTQHCKTHWPMLLILQRSRHTHTHLLFTLEHLKKSSKIVLERMHTKSYKYRKSNESTDMRTIRQSTVSNRIGHILVIYFDRAILRFLGLQHGFRQPDFRVGRDMCEKQSPKEHLESSDPWV